MHSVLTAGVSVITAATVTATPVQAAPPPTPTSAAVQLTAAPRAYTPAEAAEAPQVGDALAASAVIGVTSAGTTLMDLYFAALPCVQWGFELATYVVGWIPVVGVFSGQIMVAYYTGEPVVQSWFQSTAYALDGNFAAIPATLVNGLIDGGTAFVQSELNWLLGFFPPFPPFPPIPLATAAVAADAAAPQAAPGNPMAGIWDPASEFVDNGVALASDLLDSVGWVPFAPTANFQLNEFWGLIHAEGDAATGLAGDLITILTDAANVDDAARAALLAVQTRGGQALDAVVNFALDQVHYNTGIWIPHTVNPDVDLPQGPADSVSFGVPQLVRDSLGALAPALGLGAAETPVETSTAAPDDAAEIETERKTQPDTGTDSEKPADDSADNTNATVKAEKATEKEAGRKTTERQLAEDADDSTEGDSPEKEKAPDASGQDEKEDTKEDKSDKKKDKSDKKSDSADH